MASVRKPPEPRPSVPIARLILVAIVGLALAWLASVVSIAGFARTSNPELARTIASFDAGAAGERAFGMLEPDSGPDVRSAAAALATEAIRRDPTIVGAVRTLGVVAEADGKITQAQALFNYAERLTRRDFATQLWLIEQRVAADDVAGALGHFDKALRTSRLAPPALFPVLVNATEDGRLLQPIARLLASNPPWRKAYLQALINDAKALPNAALLVERVGQPDEWRQMTARAAGEKRPDIAARLFVRGGGTLGQPVRSFGGGSGFLPFDWELLNTGPVSTSVVELGSATVLEFGVSPTPGADIARRMLSLKPGSYVLGATAELDTTADSPTWTVECVESPVSLGAMRMPTRGDARVRFRVPDNGCRFQWLRLSVTTKGSTVQSGGRISNFALVPA